GRLAERRGTPLDGITAWRVRRFAPARTDNPRAPGGAPPRQPGPPGIGFTPPPPQRAPGPPSRQRGPPPFSPPRHLGDGGRRDGRVVAQERRAGLSRQRPPGPLDSGDRTRPARRRGPSRAPTHRRAAASGAEDGSDRPAGRRDRA